MFYVMKLRKHYVVDKHHEYIKDIKDDPKHPLGIDIHTTDFYRALRFTNRPDIHGFIIKNDLNDMVTVVQVSVKSS